MAHGRLALPAPPSSRRFAWSPGFRIALVRIPVNALALGLTAFLLPGVHVHASHPLLGYLVLGAVFGLVNAFVKPALQFLLLPLLIASLGLVVVLVDVLAFWLLDLLTTTLAVMTAVAALLVLVLGWRLLRDREDER
jgi:putative membrane protein